MKIPLPCKELRFFFFWLCVILKSFKYASENSLGFFPRIHPISKVTLIILAMFHVALKYNSNMYSLYGDKLIGNAESNSHGKPYNHI
jgi:hypothetical protein